MEVEILGAPKIEESKLTIPGDFVRPIRKMIHPKPGVRQVVLLPIKFAWCTVSLAPKGGASANLYRTISSPDDIKNDTAVWHEWDHGQITSPKWYEWENPWLAFSVECTGPTRIEIVAKYD